MGALKSLQQLPRYQQALAIAVIAGLFGLLWYQYISPMEEEIARKTNDLAGLRQTIARSVERQKALAEFKQQAAELENRLRALTAILPLERETDQILRSVQQAASSSALRILRVGPRPVIEYDVYSEWPIDMEVVGTYHNIGAFLDRIRQLPRIVNISGLRIRSRASEGADSVTASVTATYTATTFVYKGEQELGLPGDK